STRLANLLAARLATLIRRVPHRHEQFLLASLLQSVRDIKREGVVAAAVLANLVVVDPHACLPIDGPEVQQQALSGPRSRHAKHSPIPELLVRSDALPHARQS